MRKNFRDNKGFTLIELMIVVVIIGILAALAIPRFSGASRNAKASEADGPLAQMCTLAAAYYERTGTTVAADTTRLKEVGWGTQNAKYFTFDWVGGAKAEATYLGTATATGRTTGQTDLQGVTKVMDCSARKITVTGM